MCVGSWALAKPSQCQSWVTLSHVSHPKGPVLLDFLTWFLLLISPFHSVLCTNAARVTFRNVSLAMALSCFNPSHGSRLPRMNTKAWYGGLGPACLALACLLSPLTRYLVMLRGAAPLRLVPRSCTPFFVMYAYHCFCCPLPKHPSCFWSCVILDVARYHMLPGAPLQYSSEGSERVWVFFL